MNAKFIKLSLLTLATSLAMSVNAQITETATEAVENMGLGWNLGNTLDASGQSVSDFTKDAYWGGQGLESETYWGQPYTTPTIFKIMKKAGFGAIRIPVTWFNHMDKTGKVKSEWMQRVHTVVDYALDEGLYVILNVHHDTGADSNSSKSWIKADLTNYNTNKERYEYLWKQIAEEFKDYDNKLLFEGYNEMLDSYNSWCFASFNTTNKYNATSAAASYKSINNYAQSFVTTVRATGGNNASRNLVVNTYCASNGGGSWNAHLQDPLKNMALPTDNVKNHIIFQVHAYPSITTTNSAGTVTNRSIYDIRKEIDQNISDLNKYLVAKGAPVIFGEWGTNNVDSGAGKTDYDLRRSLMLQFAEYFVQATKKNGMGTFYWMGLSDGQSRTLGVFSQPDLAERMAKAYHGEDFEGEYPDFNNVSEITCFDGDKLLTWGQTINIPANMISAIGPDLQLEIQYKQVNSSDMLQFYAGDWSGKVAFKIGAKSYSGDLTPHNINGTSTTVTRTTILTFPSATYTTISQKGLLFQGANVRVYKATLLNPNATAIETVTTDAPTQGTPIYYNLSGQRISAPTKGFYIMNGKKYFKK